MASNETVPQTEAGFAGVEPEQDARKTPHDEHSSRPHPADLESEPKRDNADEALLTTDTEAQQDDSVVNPETA